MMEGACSGPWFTVLASGQGGHLRVKASRKNLQMNSELKYAAFLTRFFVFVMSEKILVNRCAMFA